MERPTRPDAISRHDLYKQNLFNFLGEIPFAETCHTSNISRHDLYLNRDLGPRSIPHRTPAVPQNKGAISQGGGHDERGYIINLINSVAGRAPERPTRTPLSALKDAPTRDYS
ncbi:hypothetical protein EVAR_99680_1 [Eumeta japonica]|uniref:Uncharacterized protein n=1 Tax=Eumeta variegata TaxID=151549 RepID=A0A4C1YKJ0_EUMVA|nr:hypothetical protein EVAR_99680_1 [Eumeta japonica]